MVAADIKTQRKRLLKALAKNNREDVLSAFELLHPADVAELFSTLEEEDQREFLAALSSEQVLKISEHFEAPDMEFAIRNIPANAQQVVIEGLPDDLRIDLLQELEPEEGERLLSFLPDDELQTTKDLLEYDENTAGGRMTTAFATVSEQMTIREAIDSLREQQESSELLSRIFVVDDQQHIRGKVRLRDLAFNKRSTLVSDIMLAEKQVIEANADQEEAANMILKYNMVALPVVNEQRQMLGIITYDDAMEIMEEESTEDLERFSGITGDSGEETYLKTSVITHVRRRFFWVLGLGLLAIASGYVIYSFEDVLSSFFLLAIYMPMVIAAGGNTGGQAATMIIRAMSLGEFTPASTLRVVWKELRVGLIIGTLLGICIALQIKFLIPGDPQLPSHISLTDVALTVALALTVQVTASTFIGAILPIGARAARLDPAVIASPAITTIVDAAGLLIYFLLAKAILGL